MPAEMQKDFLRPGPSAADSYEFLRQSASVGFISSRDKRVFFGLGAEASEFG
jgi:hypothetical protein